MSASHPPSTQCHDGILKRRRSGSLATRRRRWLCIAYAFAPINRSGTHRTLGFVTHLDRLGWDATVLTVEPGEEPVDDDLLKQVPSSTRVFRTSWTPLVHRLKEVLGWPGACVGAACSGLRGGSGFGIHTGVRSVARAEARGSGYSCGPTPAIRVGDAARKRGKMSEWLSRLLMTPDSRLGWIAPGVSAAMRAVRGNRPDIIYSTSPYMSAHVIGLFVSMRTGIPWVADFRDPWHDNPFRTLGFKSLERWDAWLEKRVLLRAGHVICNTAAYERRLGARYPFLSGKCSTIPNGFDAEVFRTLRPASFGGPGDFVFAHAGQFYGARSPIPWLSALHRVRAQMPGSVRKPHLLLIGPEDYQNRPLRELAQEYAVGDCVHVLGRMSHAQALSYLAGSDALVLAESPGSCGDLQVPGKLFEYLALGKPILAGVAASSPTAEILRESGACARFCATECTDALANEMLNMAMEGDSGLCGGNAPAPRPTVGRFDRARRAEELVAVFERLSVRNHIEA